MEDIRAVSGLSETITVSDKTNIFMTFFNKILTLFISGVIKAEPDAVIIIRGRISGKENEVSQFLIDDSCVFPIESSDKNDSIIRESLESYD